MADSENKAQSHLQRDKSPMFWDWWQENPVEIILVIFILVLFFAFPRQGCGITSDAPPPSQSTSQPTVGQPNP